MNKIISTIVISFNSGTTINNLLKSVKKYQDKSEIIIIDNHSEDETISIVKKHYDDNIILKQNNNNIGFAKACNQGAKIATGEYLLFLNPDTEIDNDFLKKIEKFIKKNKIDIAGFKIFNKNGSIQPSCGNYPTILNIFLDRIPFINKIFNTQLIRNEDFYKKIQSPDWIIGACMLIKKEVFLKLKGFDEKYFLYIEDVDLCFRAKQAGYNIYYDPSIKIVHYDMGKSKERKHFKAQQIRRGLTIFFKKYKNPFYLFIWKTILKIESFLRPALWEKQMRN